jgi:hypothetical protein
MEIPSVVEDILAEVDCDKYSLALIRWPKLTVGAYWTAGLWTAAVSPLAQQEPQQWGPFFLGGALATLSIALVMRHEVIAARSRADGRKLSGLGDVRRSIRAARIRDVKRLLEEKGYKKREDVEKLLKWVESRLSEKPAWDFQMPASLKTVLPVLLAGFLAAFGSMAGSKNAVLFTGLLLCMCLQFYGLWLMPFRPFLERERRKLMEARHLFEEVLHEPVSALTGEMFPCPTS